MLRRYCPPSRKKTTVVLDDGPGRVTREAVAKRDRGRCVCCGAAAESIHHRRGRDGKPDSHQPQNLISVCGVDNKTGCHGRIHQRRSEAQPNGWWLSRVAGEDPLTVALLVEHEARWVYLTADGGYSDEPPKEVS